MDGWISGWGGWMNEGAEVGDGWINEWVDGWVDGWTDE